MENSECFVCGDQQSISWSDTDTSRQRESEMHQGRGQHFTQWVGAAVLRSSNAAMREQQKVGGMRHSHTFCCSFLRLSCPYLYFSRNKNLALKVGGSVFVKALLIKIPYSAHLDNNNNQTHTKKCQPDLLFSRKSESISSSSLLSQPVCSRVTWLQSAIFDCLLACGDK